jgi:predicted nucleotidyltransferase
MELDGGAVVITRNTSPTIPNEITPEFLDALRAHGVVQAYVFGSTTRGEARPDSDLDLLVTFDPPVSLLGQVRVANELSALCGRQVDLITDLHPAFAPYIEPTLIPLSVSYPHGDA